MRFGFAYAILKRDEVDPYAPDPATRARADGLGVAARFEVSAPTGDSGEFASNGTGVWMPGLSADYRYRGFFTGAEVGLRLRPTQEFEGGRIGNQAYVALGAAYDILPRELFTLGAEAFLLPTFAEQQRRSSRRRMASRASLPTRSLHAVIRARRVDALRALGAALRRLRARSSSPAAVPSRSRATQSRTPAFASRSPYGTRGRAATPTATASRTTTTSAPSSPASRTTPPARGARPRRRRRSSTSRGSPMSRAPHRTRPRR